jgi:hypothetical protein
MRTCDKPEKTALELHFGAIKAHSMAKKPEILG